MRIAFRKYWSDPCGGGFGRCVSDGGQIVIITWRINLL